MPESRRGMDVIRDQRRRLAGKVALGLAIGVGLVGGAVLLDRAIEGTEHFNRAEAGNTPAEVAAQTSHNRTQAAAKAAHEAQNH
jgi:hypothetical protein